jgi:hypothetical protein
MQRRKIGFEMSLPIGTQSLTKLNIAKGSICRGFDHLKYLALEGISNHQETCLRFKFSKRRTPRFSLLGSKAD